MDAEENGNIITIHADKEIVLSNNDGNDENGMGPEVCWLLTHCIYCRLLSSIYVKRHAQFTVSMFHFYLEI